MPGKSNSVTWMSNPPRRRRFLRTTIRGKERGRGFKDEMKRNRIGRRERLANNVHGVTARRRRQRLVGRKKKKRICPGEKEI